MDGTQKKKIDDILSRGTAEFIDPHGTFRDLLIAKASGARDVVIKFGVDPTKPDIHLGHAVALRKLRQLQDIGCKVIFLIGDYTAEIGDPTGKSKVRPEVERAAIESNLKTYLDQVGKILRTDAAVFAWIRNSTWHNKADGLKRALLALKHVTHAQLVERDMFQDRIKSGEPLYMHEMLYPVLQGIDSHMIGSIFGGCDLELGGSDQTFNMLMGRRIMEGNKKAPQAVLAVRLLVGLDGKEKMSKSLDNYIGVTDAPADMYGKVMSIPDAAIPEYLELATYSDLATVALVRDGLASGTLHPKKEKMRLARQIVEIYHGREKAEEAEQAFESVFARGEIPDDVRTISVAKGTLLVDALATENIVTSRSGFRRLIDGCAIAEMDGEKITDPFAKIERAMTLRIGKKRFLKIEAVDNSRTE